MFWSKTLNRGFSSLHPPLDLRRQFRATDNINVKAQGLCASNRFAAMRPAEHKLLYLIPGEKPAAEYRALRQAIIVAYYPTNTVRIAA